MQGADKINDELEVGFAKKFETRWGRIERRGDIVLAVLTAVGPSGLPGRGPPSHHTARSAASGLTVDFEPITRSRSGTQVTFHFDDPSDAATIEPHLQARLNDRPPPGWTQFVMPWDEATKVIFRSVFAYIILLLAVRLIGRRMASMMAPFDIVVLFLFGGAPTSAVPGDDHSMVAAIGACSPSARCTCRFPA